VWEQNRGGFGHAARRGREVHARKGGAARPRRENEDIRGCWGGGTGVRELGACSPSAAGRPATGRASFTRLRIMLAPPTSRALDAGGREPLERSEQKRMRVTESNAGG
jgi:hypothetical protein